MNVRIHLKNFMGEPLKLKNKNTICLFMISTWMVALLDKFLVQVSAWGFCRVCFLDCALLDRDLWVCFQDSLDHSPSSGPLAALGPWLSTVSIFLLSVSDISHAFYVPFAWCYCQLCMSAFESLGSNIFFLSPRSDWTLEKKNTILCFLL